MNILDDIIFLSQLLNTIEYHWVPLSTIEYEGDSFASNSDDFKKIQQAENKALAKNKNQNPL